MSQDVRDGSITLAGVTLPSRWAAHPVVAAENVRPGWDATHVRFSDDALLVRLHWRERTDGWRWSQHTLAVEVDDAGDSVLAIGSPAGAARLILDAGDALAPVTRTSVRAAPISPCASSPRAGERRRRRRSPRTRAPSGTGSMRRRRRARSPAKCTWRS